MAISEGNAEDDGVPRPDGVVEQRCYFDTPGTLTAIFAADPVSNLKRAARKLEITLVSRDNWVQINAPDQPALEKAERFLQTLQELYRLTGVPLMQHDFDQILNACAENRSGDLKECFAERIKVSPRKREIMPRTPTQLDYVRALRKKSVVFGVGPAGTGKTYLAMAMAVSKLLAGDCDRIILTRPAVEAGENLGFLPGKLEEKINPYLRPLYDALYDMMDFAEAEQLISRNIIEVAPLAFMRGRTLNNAFIILDEAQNATPEQMLMFLTRLGFKSQCVICGDPSQTDLPHRKASGLADAVRRLEPIPEIAVCRFNAGDVVRHRLVEKIVLAYAEKQEDPENEEVKHEAILG